MAIWIHSLSWTLIYGLGQGLIVYGLLRLAYRLTPSASAAYRYALSVSGLFGLLVWFAVTWAQQYAALAGIPSGHAYTLSALAVSPVSVAGQGAGQPAFFNGLFPFLAGFYVAGVAVMLLRLLVGLGQTVRLRTAGITAPDAALNHTLSRLAATIGCSVPGLLVSARAHTPMVVGCIKPVILLPAAALIQLNPYQLETILLHELAHIKRHDYLVNLLQTIAETILFFNPFVWLISATVRAEREMCCDDIAVGHIAEPLCYAEALAALATHHAGNNPLTIAATGKHNQLYNRILRIMEPKKSPLGYSRTIAAVALTAAIGAATVLLMPGCTQPAQATQAALPKAAAADSAIAPQTDETRLANSLMADGVVDQMKGFVVEKNLDKLYINGALQAADITDKYLKNITQKYIRLQVHSFSERLQMHPEASLQQLILPVTNSSPCVDKKPGC